MSLDTIVDYRGANVTVYAFSARQKGNKFFEWTRTFSAQPVNFIGLRDDTRNWWQDVVYETVNFVEKCKITYPSHRTVAIGASMGGFGAMLFGQLCNLDRTIAIAAQSCCWEVAIKGGDNRWGDEYRAIKNPMYPDIADFPFKHCDMYVSKDNKLDMWHAERVKNANKIYYKRGGHHLARVMYENGTLAKVIAKAIE